MLACLLLLLLLPSSLFTCECRDGRKQAGHQQRRAKRDTIIYRTIGGSPFALYVYALWPVSCLSLMAANVRLLLLLCYRANRYHQLPEKKTITNRPRCCMLLLLGRVLCFIYLFNFKHFRFLDVPSKSYLGALIYKYTHAS